MLLFLDIETTGLEADKCKPIEIAAIRYHKGQAIDRFECLINLPLGSIFPQTIQSLTGITEDMLASNGISLAEAQTRLHEFLRDDDIITGHNISFDIDFLQYHGFTIPQKRIDTFVLSTAVLGRDEESHSLEILSKKYGFTHENAHRAMSDVEANILLWEFLEVSLAHQLDTLSLDILLPLFKKMQLSETLFFQHVIKQKETLIKKTLPTGKPLLPQKRWVENNELTEVALPLLEEKSSAWIEINGERTYLKSLCELAQAKSLPLAFCYPSKRAQDGWDMSLSLTQSGIENEFYLPYQQQIDYQKLEQFLAKPSFTPLESKVLLKVFFALERRQINALRLMGEEKSLAPLLFCDALPEQEYSQEIIFAPLSSIQNIPEKYHRIILQSDEIEQLLTDELQEKQFARNLLESLDTHHLENKEQIIDFVNRFASTLQKKAGESIYSTQFQMSQIREDTSFSPFWKESQEIFACDQTLFKNTNGDFNWWKKFFALGNEESNMLCLVDIFPDGNFCLTKTPIDLSESFSIFFPENKSHLFLGEAFPRNENTLCFPFNTPESWELKILDKNLSPTLFAPVGNHELSITEMGKYMKDILSKKNKAIVVMNSNKTIELLANELQEFCSAENIEMVTNRSGSSAKIKVKIATTEKFVIIGTARTLENINLEDFDIHAIAIYKFSFDPPKQALLSLRRQFFEHDFEDFMIPRARARFLKQLGKIAATRAPHIVFCADIRIKETSSLYTSFLPKAVECKIWELSL